LVNHNVYFVIDAEKIQIMQMILCALAAKAPQPSCCSAKNSGVILKAGSRKI
jgi:hypothetical protein